MDQKAQKNWRSALVALACLGIANAPHVHAVTWRVDQALVLRHYIAAAPEDALPVLGITELESALRDGPGEGLDRTATALSLQLAQMHLLGVSTAQQKAGWRIVDSDRQMDIEAWLQWALAADDLPTFFTSVRPAYPDYAALRAAYGKEADPGRRLTLARNMERWRWLPRSLGNDHVLVNAAFFEAKLWRNGRQAGSWPVIVGKTSTPTPVLISTSSTDLNNLRQAGSYARQPARDPLLDFHDHQHGDSDSDDQHAVGKVHRTAGEYAVHDRRIGKN